MSKDVVAPPDIPEQPPDIVYTQYSLAKESIYLPQIRDLISRDLSEPYSIYVYRYFLYQWPDLCFVAIDPTPPAVSPSTTTQDEPPPLPPPKEKVVGVVICKLEPHRGGPMRGYIAMLATSTTHRNRGIATTLVTRAIDLMIEKKADEIALETEETNTAAMKLYERLGFLRSKKLHRYYLNGNSAYRLLLYLREGVGSIPTDDGGRYGDQSPGYDDLPPSAQDDPNDLLSRGIV